MSCENALTVSEVMSFTDKNSIDKSSFPVMLRVFPENAKNYFFGVQYFTNL